VIPIKLIGLGGEKGGQTFLGADYLAIYLHINHGFQSLEIIVFATLNLLEGNLQLQFFQKIVTNDFKVTHY
jgi:hypothetical protein